MQSIIVEIAGIADNIIKGLIFIHKLKEVHRDLSPQNGAACSKVNANFIVFYSVESKSWKIADFGLTSEATSNHLITRRYGKRGYRVPELISVQFIYNNKTDMSALGCIIAELITGMKTFSGDYAVVQYAMKLGEQSCSLDPVSSRDGKLLLGVFFVTNLLSPDLLKRPSAKHLESLYQIPMFCLQSGLPISTDAYKQTALDALSKSGRMDLALAIVETLFASGVSFDESPWLGLVQKLSGCAASKRDRKLMSTLIEVKVNVTSISFQAVDKGGVWTYAAALRSSGWRS